MKKAIFNIIILCAVVCFNSCNNVQEEPQIINRVFIYTPNTNLKISGNYLNTYTNDKGELHERYESFLIPLMKSDSSIYRVNKEVYDLSKTKAGKDAVYAPLRDDFYITADDYEEYYYVFFALPTQIKYKYTKKVDDIIAEEYITDLSRERIEYILDSMIHISIPLSDPKVVMLRGNQTISVEKVKMNF